MMRKQKPLPLKWKIMRIMQWCIRTQISRIITMAEMLRNQKQMLTTRTIIKTMIKTITRTTIRTITMAITTRTIRKIPMEMAARSQASQRLPELQRQLRAAP